MASELVDAIEDRIRDSVRSLAATESYRTWAGAEKEKRLRDGDVIVLNNSFLERGAVPTVKHVAYLATVCDGDGMPKCERLGTATPKGFNVDVHWFPQAKGPLVSPLHDVVPSAIASLGDLLFILLGTPGSGASGAVTMTEKPFVGMRLDPGVPAPMEVEGGKGKLTLAFPDLARFDAARDAALDALVSEGKVADGDRQSLELALGRAYSGLCADACGSLSLPRKGDEIDPRGSLLAIMGESVSEQIKQYSNALRALRAGPDAGAKNDILRLAYNFATDASRLVRLIMRICDTKPLVMWCTVREHYGLACAIRGLMGVPPGKKPSLSAFEEGIKGARNHAFHDLFPFICSMDVDLSGVPLNPHLRIFPAYVGRKKGGLSYNDQEIVDILMEFTRAPESQMSADFWEVNLTVMNATSDLVSATVDTLVLLRRATWGASP